MYRLLGRIAALRPAARVGKLQCAVDVIEIRLTFRTIDPRADAALVAAHHHEACVASFGDDKRYQGGARYLKWLRARVEEFPDGHLLAFLDGECIGQLELQVPFGLAAGYVNLFYVTPPYRGLGFAPLLHDRAEQYFRSWDATRIELHVSPVNERAVAFYRKMGYRLTRVEPRKESLWLMTKEIPAASPSTKSSDHR